MHIFFQMGISRIFNGISFKVLEGPDTTRQSFKCKNGVRIFFLRTPVKVSGRLDHDGFKLHRFVIPTPSMDQTYDDPARRMIFSRLAKPALVRTVYYAD